VRLRIVVSVAAWACGVVTVGVAVRVRLEMRFGVEEQVGISDAILVLVAVPDAVGIVVSVAVAWKVTMSNAGEQWVRCPACRGEGRTLHTSLEIEEVCPRCSGVGEELADCVSDSTYGSDRLSRLRSTLASQIVYHLQLGYGINGHRWTGARRGSSAVCGGHGVDKGGQMTLSDQLISAIASGPGLSPEEVADWVVRYEAETGDTSLRGVTTEELMLLLLPHPGSCSRSCSRSVSTSRSGSRPSSRPSSRSWSGSGSGSGSWSGSWSASWSGFWSDSWSGSWSRSRSRSGSSSGSWSWSWSQSRPGVAK